MDVLPSTRTLRRAETTETLEPRVMQVLVALSGATGAVVSRDDLIISCWDGRIVGDNAIQRTISRLREIADGIGSGCFRLETVNKVGYRLIEIESAGAADPNRLEQPFYPSASPTDRLSRLGRWLLRHRLAATCVAILAIAAGLAAIRWQSAETAAPPSPVRTGRIVVTPFASYRGDPVLAHLAQNTEEFLLRSLTNASLSPGTVGPRQARDPNPEFEIGGSVGRSGTSVFVDVWVDDRAGGVRAWSGRFKRAAEDADGLDEKVGETVAQDLKWTIDLRRSASHPLSSQQLSMLYNASDAVLRMADRERDVTARFVEMAPDFAGSHALRAMALVDYDETIDHFDGEERAVADEARASAERAIAMDPNSALAWSALGYRIGREPRFAEREKALQHALAIQPDLDVARIRYVILLREVGRLDAALELAQQIENLPIPHLAFLYAMMGDWPGASQIMERIKVMEPKEGANTLWLGHVWWGDPRHMTPELWRSGYASTNAGLVSCFESHIRSLIAANGTPLRDLPPTCANLSEDALAVDWRIRMLAREGDIDGAYAELDRAPLSNTHRWTMFLFYPEMAQFRRDPRFRALTERVGLRDYWLATDQWPDFCREEKTNAACQGYRLRVHGKR
jgi:DNA-binding winged helix-turn-helix (wHTH) protein/tetratricopeptide (TPR) repeat protein